MPLRSCRWNESPSTTCALMPSRRKMWAKLCITVVVPAPLDPVTAMIGCLTDMRTPGCWLSFRAEGEESQRLVLPRSLVAALLGRATESDPHTRASGRYSDRSLKSGEMYG